MNYQEKFNEWWSTHGTGNYHKDMAESAFMEGVAIVQNLLIKEAEKILNKQPCNKELNNE